MICSQLNDYVPGCPFLGVSIWRELNDRGMNFIPTWETRNSVETSFAAWHPDFWSGFARRGTVVPGGECVKKTAGNCKFPAEFATELSTVCGSWCSFPVELRGRTSAFA
jgi:hypothetical protein